MQLINDAAIRIRERSVLLGDEIEHALQLVDLLADLRVRDGKRLFLDRRVRLLLQPLIHVLPLNVF